MENYAELVGRREEVAYYMRRLYRKDLTSSSGGNISLRLPDRRILITPSALDKGELSGDQVALLDPEGKNLCLDLAPTMEVELHLAIYRVRPDVSAVMHAHPPFASSFACSGVDIRLDLTPEARLVVGRLTKAPYHPAGSRELAEAVALALASEDARAALMLNHGVTTVGASMFQAFDRLEVVELAARMTWIARSLGQLSGLPAPL
ncbi:MAG: class II aldolase/adducin family protein [Planctomycetota bacterium]|jgi:L-fuculose-phosphate aldolase|nr:class II aldolase/adducin family protein [Planctomycetota bacterium]